MASETNAQSTAERSGTEDESATDASNPASTHVEVSGAEVEDLEEESVSLDELMMDSDEEPPAVPSAGAALSNDAASSDALPAHAAAARGAPRDALASGSGEAVTLREGALAAAKAAAESAGDAPPSAAATSAERSSAVTSSGVESSSSQSPGEESPVTEPSSLGAASKPRQPPTAEGGPESAVDHPASVPAASEPAVPSVTSAPPPVAAREVPAVPKSYASGPSSTAVAGEPPPAPLADEPPVAEVAARVSEADDTGTETELTSSLDEVEGELTDVTPGVHVNLLESAAASEASVPSVAASGPSASSEEAAPEEAELEEAAPEEAAPEEAELEEAELEEAVPEEAVPPAVGGRDIPAVAEAEAAPEESVASTGSPAGSDGEPPAPNIQPKSGNTSPLPSYDEAAARAARAAATPPAIPVPDLALSTMEEDEDDAVTHIGLPLPEASEPPMPSPPVAPMDPVPSVIPVFQQSRNARTVVLPRTDPPVQPPQPSPLASGVDQVKGWFNRPRSLPPYGATSVPSRSARSVWDRALPIASWGLFVAGITGLAAVLLSGSRTESSEAQAQVESSAVESASSVQALRAREPEAKTPEPPAPGGRLAERARRGEQSALFQLAQRRRGERTADDTLAMEEGKAEQARRELSAFLATLGSEDSTRNQLVRVMGYATDPATMVPAFRALAELPGTKGPDVMYAIWAKAQGGSAAARLAFDLLYSSDLRSKASEALSVVLDLRQARSCEDYERVLPRVVEHADRRALLSLRPLTHRDSCGVDGTEDCYPCLRDSDLLDRALAAAESRSGPTL